MPTYIAFGDWTEQGIRAISDSPPARRGKAGA